MKPADLVEIASRHMRGRSHAVLCNHRSNVMRERRLKWMKVVEGTTPEAWEMEYGHNSN